MGKIIINNNKGGEINIYNSDYGEWSTGVTVDFDEEECEEKTCEPCHNKKILSDSPPGETDQNSKEKIYTRNVSALYEKNLGKKLTHKNASVFSMDNASYGRYYDYAIIKDDDEILSTTHIVEYPEIGEKGATVEDLLVICYDVLNNILLSVDRNTDNENALKHVIAAINALNSLWGRPITDKKSDDEEVEVCYDNYRRDVGAVYEGITKEKLLDRDTMVVSERHTTGMHDSYLILSKKDKKNILQEIDFQVGSEEKGANLNDLLLICYDRMRGILASDETKNNKLALKSIINAIRALNEPEEGDEDECKEKEETNESESSSYRRKRTRLSSPSSPGRSLEDEFGID